MRRLLGVLRSEEDDLPTAPQPGLADVDALVEKARAAGLDVSVERDGLATVPPTVGLAAYRIVQEALTNARRHAPGAAVDVELHYADDSLLVRIRDNGPGPPPALRAGGHGLLGMRERAAAVGGRLRSGPAPGGGFLVTADLPGKGDEAR
jgi:signal transduction histidine kinase